MPLGLRVEETLAHLRGNGGITLALRKLAVLESLLIVQNGLRGPSLEDLRIAEISRQIGGVVRVVRHLEHQRVGMRGPFCLLYLGIRSLKRDL